jgi:hypothetical protein
MTWRISKGRLDRLVVFKAAKAFKAFGLGAQRARDIYDEVAAGMRRLGEVLDHREVTAKDRGTVMPLLAACLDPPAWG